MQEAQLCGPYNPVDPVILELSMVEKHAVRNLWQAPIGESQCRPLEFWSKIVLFTVGNDTPFKDNSQNNTVP